MPRDTRRIEALAVESPPASSTALNSSGIAEGRDGIVRAPELTDDPEDARREMKALRAVSKPERIRDDAQVTEHVLPLILHSPEVICGADQMLSCGSESRRGVGDLGEGGDQVVGHRGSFRDSKI
jgi:hypothetical protein